MKQEITIEQWDQLSFHERFVLIEWLQKEGYAGSIVHPLDPSNRPFILDIGQLIHFVMSHGEYTFARHFSGSSTNRMWVIKEHGKRVYKYPHKELVDSLWFLVREILTKK